jgi:hypothetical protein
MAQPEAWGDIPFGPVSWNGVASPGAVSGLAGTMRTQLTLAAAAAGVAEDVAGAVGDALAVAAGLADAVALAAGVPLAEAAPCADSRKLAFRSLTSLIPRTSPTAIVMTRGTAISMNRPLGAPGADQCRLRIKSTSMPLSALPLHAQLKSAVAPGCGATAPFGITRLPWRLLHP